MTSSSTPAEPALADYLRDLRHNWKIIAGTTVLVVLLAVVFSLRQASAYLASAEVMLQKPPTSDNLIGQAPRDTGTDVALARSRVVQDTTERKVGFEPKTTVRQIGDTSVIEITAKASTPRKAVQAADAYAAAFIEVRTAQILEPLTAARSSLESELNATSVEPPGGSGSGQSAQGSTSDLAALAESVRTAAVGQNPAGLRAAITALERAAGVGPSDAANRVIRAAGYQFLVDQLRTAEALAGKAAPQIVSHAKLPRHASQPATGRNVALALGLGIMLGVGLALARSYLDRRVLDVGTLQAAGGLPVLAVVRAAEGGRSHRSSVSGGLTNGVIDLRAALQLRQVPDRAKVIQLTSATPVSELAELGLELAAAFSRTERSVILVHADFHHLPRPSGAQESLSLSNLGVQDIDRAFPASSGIEHLEVLPAGTAPQDPAAFLGSRTLEDVVTRLRSRADIVLVVAPPVLAYPDPLLISRVVDASILVVSAGVARATEVVEAAERFASVGHELLGTVLLTGRIRPPQTGSSPTAVGTPLAGHRTVDNQSLALDATRL